MFSGYLSNFTISLNGFVCAAKAHWYDETHIHFILSDQCSRERTLLK